MVTTLLWTPGSVSRAPGHSDSRVLFVAASSSPSHTHTILTVRSNSPQGLELYRRRVLVTVSPPEIWVPNLEGENGLS